MITRKWQANVFRCLSFADLEGVRDSLASFGEQVKAVWDSLPRLGEQVKGER